jgi:hypothetical protein
MSETFDGTVDVQDGSGNTTILLDGSRGAFIAGGGGQDGSVHVGDTAGVARILLGADGSITSRDASAGTVFGLYGDGQVCIRRLLAADYITVFEFLSPHAALSIAARARAARSISGTMMATTPSFSTAPRATSTSLAPTARRISPCATPRPSSLARCW